MTDSELDDTDSCLIAKLSHYVTLTDASRTHLARLEKSEREFVRHDEVLQGGERIEDLFVVKRGWLYSYTDLPDGRRQIIRIHVPGDVIGLPDVAFEHATTTLRAAEDCCLCPFPKSELDRIFIQSPQLTALLFTIAARDHVVFIDLIRAMGRMSARERIAHLLLDLRARLRITNPSMTDTIRLPLTQWEIADVLGLTNVYVSKTIAAMEASGDILRTKHGVTIRREEYLTEMCDFIDRYDRIDTSWFPSSEAT